MHWLWIRRNFIQFHLCYYYLVQICGFCSQPPLSYRKQNSMTFPFFHDVFLCVVFFLSRERFCFFFFFYSHCEITWNLYGSTNTELLNSVCIWITDETNDFLPFPYNICAEYIVRCIYYMRVAYYCVANNYGPRPNMQLNFNVRRASRRFFCIWFLLTHTCVCVCGEDFFSSTSLNYKWECRIEIAKLIKTK